MSETITAMYDSRSDADAAADKLVEAGVSRSAIRVMDQVTDGSEAGRSTLDRPADDHSQGEGGFWAMLKGLFMPDEDRRGYAERMSRGSAMLSVTVDDDQVDIANGVLEECGAIDIRQRAADGTTGGWSGYPDTPVPTETSAMPTPSGMVTPEPTDPLIAAEQEEEAAPTTPEVDRRPYRQGTYGAEPATGDGSDDPALQAQLRPSDRAASANAEGLFGEETPDSAEIPVGSPGAREDVAAAAGREASRSGRISRDQPPQEDMPADEDDERLAEAPRPPRGTPDIRRGF